MSWKVALLLPSDIVVIVITHATLGVRMIFLHEHVYLTSLADLNQTIFSV